MIQTNALTKKVMPNWPRLMGVELAAAYCGISAQFLRDKGPKPRELGARRLYDIRSLDRWADALDGQPLAKPEIIKEAEEVEARFLEQFGGKN